MSKISYYVIEDCLNITQRFAQHCRTDFSYFVQEWNKMGFEYVFACLRKYRNAISLTDLFLSVTKDMLLKKRMFYERLGALYLMYTIYYLQPLKLHCKLKFSLQSWKELKEFMQLLRESTEDTKQAQYILCKLYIENAFRFHHSETYVGLERYLRPGYQQKPEDTGQFIDKVVRDDFNEITNSTKGMIAAMTALQEKYNDMKKILNRSGGSKFCGTLDRIDVVENLKSNVKIIKNQIMKQSLMEEAEEEENIPRLEDRRQIKRRAFFGNIEDPSAPKSLKNESTKTKAFHKQSSQGNKKVVFEALPKYILKELEVEKSKTQAHDLKPIIDLDEDFYECGFVFDKVKVSTMADLDFQRAFRMQRSTFEELLQKYTSSEECRGQSSSSTEIDNETDMFMFLWFIGREASLDETATAFDYPYRVATRKINAICEFICSLKEETIFFPQTAEQRQLAVSDFQKITELSGILGYVYSTCFKVPKKETPIRLQGVFDAKKRFLSVSFTEEMDATSELELISADIMEVNDKGDDFMWILSKLTMLKQCIIKPFVKNDNLTAKQKYFNQLYVVARALYRDVFEILCTRFPRLNYLDMTSDNAKRVILACCVLYNFCIDNEDYFNEFINIEAIINENEHYVGCNKPNPKRDEILERLPERKLIIKCEVGAT